MLTGLLHSHKYLGYLLFLVLFLTFAGARRSPGLAKAVRVLAKGVVQGIGGVVMLAGIFLWWKLNHTLGSPWIWASVLLWAPVTIAGKRLVGAEADRVIGGEEVGGRMILGVLVQILCVTAIIGLMTVKPGMGG